MAAVLAGQDPAAWTWRVSPCCAGARRRLHRGRSGPGATTTPHATPTPGSRRADWPTGAGTGQHAGAAVAGAAAGAAGWPPTTAVLPRRRPRAGRRRATTGPPSGVGWARVAEPPLPTLPEGAGATVENSAPEGRTSVGPSAAAGLPDGCRRGPATRRVGRPRRAGGYRHAASAPLGVPESGP
ncbi:hypothetical protein QJS66_13195 [Kocuria rhizophila]|nr:hypothetical protein QJS66_13195 [Kocuria rhizophila]